MKDHDPVALPDVKAKGSKPLLTYTPSGMVSVFIGGDTWASGTNDCAFGGGGFLPGATLTVDAKVLVDKGVLTAGR